MLDDSSSSSDSDDSFSFLNHTSLLGPRNRNNPCFEFEEDMIAEFEKDAELCMKAVCALYRQQTSVSKSPMCLEFSSNQSPGFNKYDALRGTTLAEFLIDGDTEGKLRKSATELEQHDKNGLSDCKRLAIGHSKQLFEIFRK
ncbi:hypothetical protein CJ030_MR0G023007 [Morella rubra]|nr:hypothetical protein CJ030_MR0G023007 [Morella rubra]